MPPDVRPARSRPRTLRAPTLGWIVLLSLGVRAQRAVTPGRRQPGARDGARVRARLRGARPAAAARADARAPAAPALAPPPPRPVLEPGRVLPPRRAIAWTAEQRWRPDNAAFEIVAWPADGGGEVTVARSAPLGWRPGDHPGLDAVMDAAGQLDEVLTRSGWEILPPGAAWFSRRFGWTPEVPLAPARPPVADARAADAPAADAPVADAPVADAPAADAPAADAPAAGVPAPEAEIPAAEPAPARPPLAPGPPGAWPDGADAWWRCEISWDSGYARSRFRAVARPPRGPRRRCVAASEPFAWLLKGDPDVRAPAFPAAVRALAGSLIDAGWEPAGRGRHWYAQRFVWRGEGGPPLDGVAR